MILLDRIIELALGEMAETAWVMGILIHLEIQIEERAALCIRHSILSR